MTRIPRPSRSSARPRASGQPLWTSPVTTGDNAPVRARTSARAVLIASAVFGLAYFVHGLGFEAPYPVDVVIKAMGIVLLAVYARLHEQTWLAAALVFGAIGDVLLALQPAQMSLGIAAFGLGHIIYLGLFIDLGRREGSRGTLGWVGAGAVALFGVVMLVGLQPYFGELRVPASLYNGVIIAMACAALAVRSPTLAWVGALSFVVSDTLLALRLFAHLLPWAGPVVWLSYYFGQAGLALGLSQAPGR
jgi:uncharacterized membrane protein YhhN